MAKCKSQHRQIDIYDKIMQESTMKSVTGNDVEAMPKVEDQGWSTREKA